MWLYWSSGRGRFSQWGNWVIISIFILIWFSFSFWLSSSLMLKPYEALWCPIMLRFSNGYWVIRSGMLSCQSRVFMSTKEWDKKKNLKDSFRKFLIDVNRALIRILEYWDSINEISYIFLICTNKSASFWFRSLQKANLVLIVDPKI